MIETAAEYTALRNRVKELRTRLGLRQSDLAEATGVTRQTIIAIEQGRLNPSILLGLKIARVLREPVEYVFFLDRIAGTPPLKSAAAPGRRKRAAEPPPSEETEASASPDAAPPSAPTEPEPPAPSPQTEESQPAESAEVFQVVPPAEEEEEPAGTVKARARRRDAPDDSPQAVFDFG